MFVCLIENLKIKFMYVYIFKNMNKFFIFVNGYILFVCFKKKKEKEFEYMVL